MKQSKIDIECAKGLAQDLAEVLAKQAVLMCFEGQRGFPPVDGIREEHVAASLFIPAVISELSLHLLKQVLDASDPNQAELAKQSVADWLKGHSEWVRSLDSSHAADCECALCATKAVIKRAAEKAND